MYSFHESVNVQLPKQVFTLMYMQQSGDEDGSGGGNNRTILCGKSRLAVLLCEIRAVLSGK